MKRLQMIHLRVLLIFLLSLGMFEVAFGATPSARHSARSLPLSIRYTCPIEETGNVDMIQNLIQAFEGADQDEALDEELEKWEIQIEFRDAKTGKIKTADLDGRDPDDRQSSLQLLSLINPKNPKNPAGVALGSRCEFGVCPTRGKEIFIPTRGADYAKANWVDPRMKNIKLIYSRETDDGSMKSLEVNLEETLIARLPSFLDYRAQSDLRSWAKRFQSVDEACVFQYICGPGKEEQTTPKGKEIKLESIRKTQAEFSKLLDELRTSAD